MADALDQIIAPFAFSSTAAAPALQTAAQNSSTYTVDYICAAEEAAAITDFIANCSSVTGAPGNTVWTLRDVSGGAGGSTVHATATAATAAAGENIFNFATPYTPAVGELICFRSVTAGAGAGDFYNWITSITNITACNTTDFTSHNGTKQTSRLPIFGYKTATRTYGYPILGIEASDFTTTEQRGFKFNPPSTWYASYQIKKFVFVGRTPAAAGAFDLTVHSNGGASQTVRQTCTRDTDDLTANSANGQSILLTPAALYAFTSGTDAVFAVLTPASINCRIHVLTFASAASAFPMTMGGRFHYISRTVTTNVFTEDQTRVPLAGMMLADITAPAGGGGIGGRIIGGGG